MSSGTVIQLVEFESRDLHPTDLTPDEADIIYRQFGDKVSIEWPTPKTDNLWQLKAMGWVGFIPLGENRGISLQPKVSLGNLFRMLEYAYDLASFRLLEGLYDCESLREFYERIAAILALRLLDRARMGLYRTYRTEDGELSFVKGRIDMSAIARTPVRTTVPCSFEEHTIDVEDNRIVAWALHVILRSGICTDRSVEIIRKADRVLRHSVALTPFCGLDCSDRAYNRLNADYEILHRLCQFFLESTGPTQNLGDRSMVPFLVDMAKLFEVFVARWLDQHLDPRYILKQQESFTVGEKGALKMIMDLVIYDRTTGEPICVLDTKYKADSTVSNDDYYQVVAYADRLGCGNAVLVYPEQLECQLDESPGRIRVRTAEFAIGDELGGAGRNFLEQLYMVFS